MSTCSVTNPTAHVNTPFSYRLAGSCGFRAYVNCDDTPYHLEQPISTGGGQNANYDADFAGKLKAIRATREGGWRSYRALKSLIDDNPEATVAELIGLLN